MNFGNYNKKKWYYNYLNSFCKKTYLCFINEIINNLIAFFLNFK